MGWIEVNNSRQRRK